MYDGRLNPVAVAVGKSVGKRAVLGGVLGAWLLLAGPAFAATSSLGSTSSTLLSEQSSVVAEAIKADAQDCADGTKEGTIGASINDALRIHTELAAATPNVESLFSATADCFGGLGSLFDLSGSIPSLGSIFAAAQQAVLKYAQKKVCTAVQQVSSMVTSPINQAIGKVSSGTSLADLNGLTNGLVSKGMSTLDPELGSSYHSTPAGYEATYTVDVNPFNYIQTDFGGGASTGTGTGTGTTTSSAATTSTVAPAASTSSSSTSSSTSSSSSGSASGSSGSAAGLFN
ncbi:MULTISPECIES: hypothetical protein [Pseudomonas]|uniref:hypothetical protein n=1 Tax=Pseudomonas TaxID=286 RepID=UPI00224A7A38|nr:MULTISPECIES: hypothetical protein [unclassified Pseudomonas]MCX2889502.1 hypothetical protein [Pseudomonas sp. DCB_BI]MDH4552338.1 hypothetical protein [Pseudomonas sp. BN607]